MLQPPCGRLVGLSSTSGLFVLGWCNAYAMHEQLALAWCGCALLCVLHGCHLCFLRQVASAVWFLQVRPSGSANQYRPHRARDQWGQPYGVSSRSGLLSFAHGRGCSLSSSLNTDSLRVPSVCCVQVVAGVLEVFPSDTTMRGGSASSAPWIWSTPGYTVAAV
jgi:hypothetical protein